MSSTVLSTYPSESNPDKVYEVCRDDSNGGRLWCRVQGQSGGCMAWTVGWKRQGYAYHTCKHTRAAIASLGMRVRVDDGFEYVESAGIAGGTAVPARPLNTASTRLNALAEQARAANVANALAANERAARRRPLGVPSLETVKRAAQQRAAPDGVIVRTGRQRSDDE